MYLMVADVMCFYDTGWGEGQKKIYKPACCVQLMKWIIPVGLLVAGRAACTVHPSV